MIRSLSLFILLAASPVLYAQSLYKWVEDDGSITFSVEPPPEGVSYESVNSSNDESEGISSSDDDAKTLPELAKGLPVQASETADRAISANTANNERASVGIDTPTRTTIQNVNASTAPLGSVSTQTNARAGNSGAYAGGLTNQKQRQCEDLQKRIVSLEGRLRQPLSSEAMDNTVMYMAKYQRSHDQHCLQ